MEKFIFDLQLFDGEGGSSGSDTLVSGTDGDDNIANTVAGASISAGAGDDTLTNTGNNVSINAGDGNNLILGSGDGLSISAGAGNDTLSATDSSATLSGSSIDLGTGENVINYAGTLEKVLITGAATDINIGTLTSPVEGSSYAFNTISLDGGAANNVSIENFSGAALVMYLNNTSGSESNNISVSNFNGDKNILFASVNGAAASRLVLPNITGINNFFAVDFGPGDSNVYSNNDVVTVGDVGDSNEFHIWLDGGNDTITFGDFGENVSMGAVALETLNAVMGNVSDSGVIRFVGGYLNNITTGDLGNSVKVDINLQDGNDIVKIGNIGEGSTVTFIGGGGSDSVEFGTVQGNITVDSGDPKHRIFTDPQRHPEKTPVSSTSTAETNAIDLKIASIGANSNVEIKGGADADNISIGGAMNATLNITTGEGNDSINLTNAQNSQVTIDAGEGDNVVRIYHGYGNTIITGAGNDSISVSKGSSLNVYTGDGNDTIIGELGGIEDDDWSFGGYATIDAGAGDDYINPFYTDNASIYGGDGNDTIINNGQNTTINGGAGNDYIELTNNYKESTGTVEGAFVVASAGSDTLVGATLNSTVNIFADVTNAVISGSDVILTHAEGTLLIENGKDKTFQINGQTVTLDDNSCLIYKAGTVTLNGKEFTLTEDAASGVKIEVTDNGFTISHVVSEDEADKFEYDSSSIGKTFVEDITVSGDTTYSAVLSSNGLTKITGVTPATAAGVSINATVTLDGNTIESGTYFNIETDAEGIISFGDVSYQVSSDTSLTLSVAFDSNGGGVVDYVESLEGSISGKFASLTTVNDAYFEISTGDTSNLTIVADSSNATVKGLQSGSTFESYEGVAVEMQNGDLTVNDVDYSLSSDADGIIIEDRVITDLDENATLVISNKGKYTVNGTALKVSANDTVIGVSDNYAYVDSKSNPQIDSTTTTAEIIEEYGFASDSSLSASYSSDGTISVTEKGATAVVGSGTTSDTTVIIGDKGNLVIVENTAAPVTIVGGAGDDTVVTKGSNVTVDMENGGEDKIIATGGNATLKNYNPETTDGGIKLTTDDMKGDGIKFADGKVQLSGAEVSFDNNIVNIYTPDNQKQLVAFATNNSKALDYSTTENDMVLIGDNASLASTVENSTLKSGNGDDVIFAGKGDYVDAGAGINYVHLSDEGGSTLNYAKGNTTVDNFNFADGSDTTTADVIQLDGVNISGVRVIDKDVVFLIDDGHVQFTDALNQDILYKESSGATGIVKVGDKNVEFNDNANIYWAVGKNASLTVDGVEDTDTTISIKIDGSDNSTTYRGDFRYIDASNYDGASELVGDGKNNIIKASNGNSTITGGTGKDTLYGGDGSDTFIYNSGDGKDIIYGFDYTSDIIHTGDTEIKEATAKDGDIILWFEDEGDSVTIKGAEGNGVKIANDSETIVAQINDTLLTVDSTEGYYWATGENASIVVSDIADTDTTLEIKLDGSGSSDTTYRGDIKDIDASAFKGASDIAGNDKDNIIKASNGGSTIKGGAGNDALYGGDGSDTFIYSSGDGQDSIYNFEFGTNENSDVINVTNSVIETVGFNNSNLVIEFENDDDSLTIENAKGQDIQIANNTESVVAQINDNELHFDGVANFYWATGDDATISVDFGIDASSDGVVVCLDGSSEDSKYRGNVKTIDASSYIGYASLVGNDLENVIVANNSGNTLWGGSGTSNDTLFGGNGDDVFRYGKGNGKDVITSVDRGDVIDLFDINLSDLVATGNEMFSGNNMEIQLDSENTLTVKDAKNSGVTLKFADGTSLRAVNKNLSYLQEQN